MTPVEIIPATWLDRIRVREDGCWEWTGYINPTGYGYAGIEGRHEYVYREAYRRANGPIPDGMTIDHLCHRYAECQLGVTCPHRRCCNPAHLVSVTNAENVGRRWREGATCKRGHPFTDFWGGRRRCRVCEYDRIYAARGKVSPLAPNKAAPS